MFRVKHVIFHISGIFLMLVLLLSIGFFIAINQYHNKARLFWGDQFKPDSSSVKLYDEFPLSLIIPEGGPLANPHFFKVCSNVQWPLVPVRQVAADKFEALCGFGSETNIELYTVEDEQLKELLLKNWNEARH